MKYRLRKQRENSPPPDASVRSQARGRRTAEESSAPALPNSHLARIPGDAGHSMLSRDQLVAFQSAGNRAVTGLAQNSLDAWARDRDRTGAIQREGEGDKAPAAATTEVAAGPRQRILDLQQFLGNRAVRALAPRGNLAPAPVARLKGLRKVSTRGAGLAIQRWGELEHMKLGDEATRGAHGELKTVTLADDYGVTYGEMVAMGGDYFESIGQMREMAARPGPGAGTREELEYVRVEKIHNEKKKRSKEEKKQLEKLYSKAAMDAVDKRFYELATGNRSHFLNPVGGDETRTTEDKSHDLVKEDRIKWHGVVAELVTATLPLSAGAGFRQNHLQAIYEAYFAGKTGQGFDAAMAVEAFGDHFLTDAFSGGHVRTPRASIKGHWDLRVPMFNYNLKGWIAEVLAERLKTTKAHGLQTENAMYKGNFLHGGTLDRVTEMVDTMGHITLGDVVSGAIHDYDNRRGVAATISSGTVNLKGDSYLGGDAEKFATEAVRLGYQDIHIAWGMGFERKSPSEVLGRLMFDGLFLAEELLPKPKADAELGPDQKRVNWDQPDVDSLLGDPRFVEALKIFTDGKAERFAETAKGFGDADIEDAFMEGIVEPLKDHPVAVIRAVVNWTPNTGGSGSIENMENAVDYVAAAKQEGALGKLTYVQKKALIVDLLALASRGDEPNAIHDAILDFLKADTGEAKKLIDEIGWNRLEKAIDARSGSDFADTFPKSSYRR